MQRLFKLVLRHPVLRAAQFAGLVACAHPTPDIHWATRELATYRTELSSLRAQRSLRTLPPVDFFLFGMGDRPKLIFRGGKLQDAFTGHIVRDFKPQETWIVPSEAAVVMRTSGGVATIREDARGLSVIDAGKQTWLSRTPLVLPLFKDHLYPGVMRVLHQEILVNIVDGKPLPNAFAYRTPWYRDAAMMAMVLQKTGNLRLIDNWVAGLRSPFDRNNANEEEADNPGQALYLISRGSNRVHPLVPALLQALQRFEVKGRYIEGRSDFALHPVYQTLWANFGLQSLGLPQRYQPPDRADTYWNLFWWGPAKPSVTTPLFSQRDALEYPYLAWAQDHARGGTAGPLADRDYPLSWEGNASQANYARMAVIDPAYTQQKLAAPHTWHAAEMFLLLDEQRVHRPAAQ